MELRLTPKLSRFLKDGKGNLSIFMALSAIPFVATVGLAIDYSRAVTTRSNLQQISDAAALAAAAATSATDGQRQQIALRYIEQIQTVLNDARIEARTVTISGNTIKVEMKARVEAALFKLIDTSSGGSAETSADVTHDRLDVGVSSTVTFGKTTQMCLISLNATAANAMSFAGNPTFKANGCAVHANSSSSSAMKTQGSAVAQADSFCTVGGASGSGFTPSPGAGCPSVTDPFAGLAWPAVGNCAFTNRTVKNTTANLAPGVYCGGLSLQTKGKANLAPGTYIIKDGPLSMSASAAMTGTGVTIYLVGNSYIDIGSQADVDITAPSSGNLAGMAIIQHPASNPGVVNTVTAGGDIRIVGAVYMPKQTLKIWGNGKLNENSPYFPIVTDKLDMGGTADLFVNLDWEQAGFPAPAGLTSKGSAYLSY